MNVLTIDLDFVYKHMVEQQARAQIDFDFPLEPYWDALSYLFKTSEAHPGAIEFIETLVREKCKRADIHKIDQHHEILDLLRMYDTKFDLIVNVDYHHDIHYAGEYKCTEENWVLHGWKEGMLSNYAWITHRDAEQCNTVPFPHEIHVWDTKSMDDFPEFDVLVLCKSPHFTPPKFWYLMDSLANTHETKTN